MRYVAGIDLGSGLTKAAIIGENGPPGPRVLGVGQVRTGVDLKHAAERAMELALAASGLDAPSLSYIATTGFGRHSLPTRDIQITEITSAAHGALFCVPETKAVLDIGSQCTRAIAVRENGRVGTFKTNDKCAAGSGSFIARAAKYLQVPLEEVGELALRSSDSHPISSVCAVLAESEIINHVSEGAEVEDILRGIYDSLADRSAGLLRRVGLGSDLTFIGGVARQQGMIRALEQRLKIRVHVPDDCEYVCAIGAGLLGLRRLHAREAMSPEERAGDLTATV